MRLSSLPLGAATLLVAVASCTRGVDDADLSPAWVSFIDAYCGLLMPCCEAFDQPSDGASCRQRLARAIPSTSAVTPAAASCLARLRAASTRAARCNTVPAPWSVVCDFADYQSWATQGAKLPGEACSLTKPDCAQSSESPARCQATQASGGRASRCELVPTYGREGDMPCIATLDGQSVGVVGDLGGRPPSRVYLCDLDDGLYCSPDSRACTRFVPAGGACESSRADSSTPQSFQCGLTGRCAEGTNECILTGRRGGACIDGIHCDDGALCAGGVCVSLSGRCSSSAECMPGATCRLGSCYVDAASRPSRLDGLPVLACGG